MKKPSLDTRLRRIEQMLEILTIDMIRRKPYYQVHLDREVHQMVEIRFTLGKKRKERLYREALHKLLDWKDPNKLS